MPNSDVIKHEPCFSHHQKLELIQDVTDQEILHTLKSMPVDKSPRADGFPVEFYTSQ